MKYSTFYACLFVFLLTFTGCSDSTKPTISPTEEPVVHLALNGTSFDFGAEGTERRLTISAVETDSISWVIVSKRPWLSFDHIEGVAYREPATIRMYVNREGLIPGSYSALFYVVQLPDSQRTLVSTAVEVVAPEPAVVILSDDSLEFPNTVTERQIILSNGGEVPYNWSLWPEVTTEWVSVTPASGTVGQEPETLTVRIDTESLIPGRSRGRLGFTTDAGNFSVFINATVGEIIWNCEFKTQEDFLRNWEGTWNVENSALVGSPGDSMFLRPDLAPVVSDIHRIAIRGRMGGGIILGKEYGGLGSTDQSFSIAGRYAKSGNDYGFFAYTKPDDPDVPIGPLELSVWIPSDFGDGVSYAWGTIQLYSLEVWEK